MRIPYISLVVAGALAVGGCAYDYNAGYGYGYGGYGGYPADYGYGYDQQGYGYGYGSPYFGWYGDFYYPGTGAYVYDSYRRPRTWTDQERTYWTGRQQAMRSSGRNVTFHENWSGFNRRRDHPAG